jgi:hypothetical protein
MLGLYYIKIAVKTQEKTLNSFIEDYFNKKIRKLIFNAIIKITLKQRRLIFK